MWAYLPLTEGSKYEFPAPTDAVMRFVYGLDGSVLGSRGLPLPRTKTVAAKNAISVPQALLVTIENGFA
jgi:hypothetical protein